MATSAIRCAARPRRQKRRAGSVSDRRDFPSGRSHSRLAVFHIHAEVATSSAGFTFTFRPSDEKYTVPSHRANR